MIAEIYGGGSVATPGDRHGKLEVLEDLGIRDFSSYRKRVLVCRCDCGETVELLASNFNKQSACKLCGTRESAKRRTTHGLSHSRAWNSHHAMMQRCYNKNQRAYHLYGGRGIKVCQRWRGPKGFDNFVVDLGLPPNGCSLGRVDGNKGYSPANCRWETAMQQNRNTSQNNFITRGGVTKCLAEWCEIEGIPQSLVRSRYSQGLRGERLFCKQDLRSTVKRNRNQFGQFSSE